MTELVTYYARRAQEYEWIYARPERQEDHATLRARVRGLLAGRRVLELACGTGWWTEVIAPHVAEITALDANEAMLEIARAKRHPAGRVRFEIGDCHALADFHRRHDALLAAFWWSHVERVRLHAFVRGAERAVAPGARCVFIDNRYVEGSSTPIARRDAGGDTWQRRRLEDGSEHEVLKNFPDQTELLCALPSGASEICIETTTYYWLLAYRAP